MQAIWQKSNTYLKWFIFAFVIENICYNNWHAFLNNPFVQMIYFKSIK